MIRSLLSRLRGGRGDGGSTAGEAEDSGGAAGSDGEEGDEAAADDGSVWDFIPRSQYLGGYSNSGGIQRNDQERAIEGIQRQADAIERVEGEHPPDEDH